jgi:hypothetical protein
VTGGAGGAAGGSTAVGPGDGAAGGVGVGVGDGAGFGVGVGFGVGAGFGFGFGLGAGCGDVGAGVPRVGIGACARVPCPARCTGDARGVFVTW